MTSKIEAPRLSPSIASHLIEESPLSAWAAHRLLGNFRTPPSDSQKEGRMWHAAILEQSDEIIVVDVKDFRTKDAKETRDLILAEGKIPVTAAKFLELEPAAERIREALLEQGVDLSGGEKEKRILWSEATEMGAEVLCSGVLDFLSTHCIVDLKTSKTPVSIRQATMLIANSNAILQDPAYRNAVASFRQGPGVLPVIFAFVQTREPFAVTAVTLGGDFIELAHLKWRRAIETWHKCLAAGTDRKHWPGPVSGITPISAPAWMIGQEIELEVLRDE